MRRLILSISAICLALAFLASCARPEKAVTEEPSPYEIHMKMLDTFQYVTYIEARAEYDIFNPRYKEHTLITAEIEQDFRPGAHINMKTNLSTRYAYDPGAKEAYIAEGIDDLLGEDFDGFFENDSEYKKTVYYREGHLFEVDWWSEVEVPLETIMGQLQPVKLEFHEDAVIGSSVQDMPEGKKLSFDLSADAMMDTMKQVASAVTITMVYLDDMEMDKYQYSFGRVQYETLVDDAYKPLSCRLDFEMSESYDGGEPANYECSILMYDINYEPATINSESDIRNDMDESALYHSILHLDLNTPAEERKWERSSFKAAKNELSISDIMWILRGHTDIEALPEVATITKKEDHYNAFTLNITSPEFTGDENLYIDACVSYFVNLGKDYYVEAHNVIDIFVEYSGDPATDLPIYNDGAFQLPYYKFVIYDKNGITDKWGITEHYVNRTEEPGVWLPRELWAIQENLRAPVIKATPYAATPPIFLDVPGLPDEWIQQLNKLSSGQKAQIKEMYDSSDPVKNKLQGYLKGVMPNPLELNIWNGNDANLYFSEPSKASPLFVQRTALRFAQDVGWDKYHEFEDRRNVYNEITPVADVATYGVYSYGGILGVDVDTAAKEIFGDIKVQQLQLDTSWSKAILYDKYTNTYYYGLSGGGGYYVEMCPIVLDYEDTGDGYEITIIQLWHEVEGSRWSDDPLAWYYYEEEGLTYEPAGILEHVRTEVPRMKIILKNKPDGGLLFYSYEPI